MSIEEGPGRAWFTEQKNDDIEATDLEAVLACCSICKDMIPFLIILEQAQLSADIFVGLQNMTIDGSEFFKADFASTVLLMEKDSQVENIATERVDSVDTANGVASFSLHPLFFFLVPGELAWEVDISDRTVWIGFIICEECHQFCDRWASFESCTLLFFFKSGFPDGF